MSTDAYCINDHDGYRYCKQRLQAMKLLAGVTIDPAFEQNVLALLVSA